MLLALAIKGYQNTHIDLSKVEYTRGFVTDHGITINKGNQLNQKVFYFKIYGNNERFASYNIDQEYTNLKANIRYGDFLKVYYKKTNSSGFNLNVIQIEKEGQILLNKSEYESKEVALIYIGGIGGLLMLWVFIRLILKAKKVLTTPAEGEVAK